MNRTINGITYETSEKVAFVFSANRNIITANILSELGNKPVVLIGNRSFMGCDKLEYVKIPHSVKRINPFAFKACSSLEYVLIPDYIERVDKTSFEGCKNVTHVRFSQALVDRSDADSVFTQLFNAGLRTREVLLRIPNM